jgi:pyrroloquinoline-quinone synthase
MHAIELIDAARAEINLLEHPFYERWRRGDLHAGDLSAYAQQYRHAVVALARTSAAAALCASQTDAAALCGHAVEEEEHVGLWERFVTAAGTRAADGGRPVLADPLPETRDCERSWTAGEDQLEHLAVLYAIEAGQPEVSATKLDGLIQHYGYGDDDPAIEYFRVHAVRDHDHARSSAESIGRLIGETAEPESAAERMARRARAALHGNWRLLDGVDRSVRAHAAARA